LCFLLSIFKNFINKKQSYVTSLCKNNPMLRHFVCEKKEEYVHRTWIDALLPATVNRGMPPATVNRGMPPE
jgi:hypothetical protein